MWLLRSDAHDKRVRAVCKPKSFPSSSTKYRFTRPRIDITGADIEKYPGPQILIPQFSPYLVIAKHIPYNPLLGISYYIINQLINHESPTNFSDHK